MTKIHTLLDSKEPTISFEFFPPKDGIAVDQFNDCLTRLVTAKPDFVSVTYGAAGSERGRTHDVVVGIEATHPFPAMAHLTSIGHTRSEITSITDDYVANGVENILALGGDVPEAAMAHEGEYEYASDLVAHLRADYDLSIGVAAHPEGHPRSLSMERDRRFLANKLELADFGVTQFFFEAHHYFSMLEDLGSLGCHKPVLPGVIPITSASQVKRFADLAGATIPDDLVERIEAAKGTPGEVTKVGIERAVQLGASLLAGGAPGLHLYSLNRSEASLEVLRQLGLLPT